LESILEYLNKLTTDAIIDLNTKEELKNFRDNYGEMNFVVVLNKDENKKYLETDFYKCVERLSNGPFKSMFYFGLIDKKNYSYEQFESKNKSKENQDYPDIVSVRLILQNFTFLIIITHFLYLT